jgi:hypothetical protein
MKANVTSLNKKEFNGTLMVVTKVDFIGEGGRVYHSQKYAHNPEDVDPEYYQRQADVMQSDLDLTAQWAARDLEKEKKEAAADAAIGKIKHHLKLGDTMEIKDGVKNV